ncbi:MAG: 23S rRNA (uracil(1939)-C(5))-methyltransferase RlmD [Alphaproteobacteria bacterium]
MIRRSAPSPRDPVDLVIESVGAQGDGLARLAGRPVFVAGTLAGERVRARIGASRGEGLAASVITLLERSPRRVAPVCRHFGTCGGCALQHMADDDYAAWKWGLAVAALRQRGVDADVVAPLERTTPGTRRRAAFAFLRRASDVVVGFNERLSHRIIDLAECPLLHPALAAVLGPLRELLGGLTAPRSTGDVIVGWGETGLDVIIVGCGTLDLGRRERLAAFAEEHDLARLSWCPAENQPMETVVRRRPARVVFAGVAVEPPPGAFLQPSVDGEACIVRHLLAAVGTASPVADLYAGVGSLTFPLAMAGAEVHAVDGAAEAIAALREATHHARLTRVSAEVRDLAIRPLAARDLARFAAVVFDPPRAGARPQAEALAHGGPPLVVAISCNPATLARDARILVDGGYRLETVVPVDQFPWSPHLELVATFSRR